MMASGLGTVGCTLLGVWALLRLSEPFVSFTIALAIGLQLGVVALPFLAAFAGQRLRSERVGLLSFHAHVLVCSDPDGVERHRLNVHDLQKVWRGRDVHGALIVVDTPNGPVSLRLQEGSQARWIYDALATWREQRARPSTAEDDARVDALRRLTRERHSTKDAPLPIKEA